MRRKAICGTRVPASSGRVEIQVPEVRLRTPSPADHLGNKLYGIALVLHRPT